MARFTLPTLYAKKTSMRQWRVFVKGDKITKEWGVVDGKLQTGKHPVKTTKNEGKSNETTTEYQARLEATSLWVKKLDTGYAPDSKDVKGVNLANNIKALKRGQSNLNRNIAKTVLENMNQFVSLEQNNVGTEQSSDFQEVQILVMLCESITKIKNPPPENDSGNWVSQPKMDGVHCTAQYLPTVKGQETVSNANGRVILGSRGGKHFPFLSHVKSALSHVFAVDSQIILAGELYVHFPNNKPNEQNMQQYVTRRASVGRKSPHPDEKTLQLWVYDSIPRDPTGPDGNTIFSKRYTRAVRTIKRAIELHPEIKDIIKLTPTTRFHTEKELQILFTRAISTLYEGLVIKNVANVYKQDKRVRDMLKIKPHEDKDFEIVGGKEGKGGHQGCIVWKLKMDDGRTFWCTPKATREDRQNWWKNRSKYYGKMATVKILDWTDDGVPKFANVINIRDYE